MINIIIQGLITTIALVGIFILFGLLFEQINNKTEANLRTVFFNKYYLFTGLIGTPIHEFSHLLMCIIFRHKINKVELFRPIKSQNDGILGYVNHSYNTKSKYQKVGNFFIGIAPITVGITLLIVSLYFLLPNTFNQIIENVNIKEYYNLVNTLDYKRLSIFVLNEMLLITKSLFSINNLKEINFWIYFILMFSIVTHMTLSKADLKGCFSGIISLFTLIIFLLIMFNLFKVDYYFMINYLIIFNIIILSFMLLGLFFNLICLVCSYLLCIVKKLILK